MNFMNQNIIKILFYLLFIKYAFFMQFYGNM
jgi:hypothetical protein